MAGNVTVVLAEGRRVMRLARELTPEVFGALLEEYQGLLRDVFESMGGREVEVSGDSVLAAFPTAKQAALAAVAAQRAVAAREWPHGSRLAVSVGLESGEAGGGWDGPAALRCAALCDAAEGGQIFLTQAVSSLLEKENLGELLVRDLGDVSLRRSEHKVRAFELVVPLASRERTPETVLVAAPEVRYAKSGDVNIAFSVVGEGPVDLVFAPGFISNVEHGWEDPGLARFYRSLGSFSRLIVFDKRGTGLSDRTGTGEPLETRMDDVRAVMDAVGSARAAIVGYSEGGSMATLFAATNPERTMALILYGALIAGTWSPETPWAWRREQWDAWLDDVQRRWGTPAYCEEELRNQAPNKAGDEAFGNWYATRLRLGASPGAAAAMIETAREVDLAHVLPTVRVPTLVLHRVGDRVVDVRNARYVAERIPGARYVELPGDDHLPWVGDADSIVGEIETFLASAEERLEDGLTDRVLATVLFTDIVDSTAKTAEIGDRRWRELIVEHHARVRRQLVRFRGRELDTAGEGFFASFDGPARAIRCACAISESVSELGLELRAGLHTGECEVVDGKVGGIAFTSGRALPPRPGLGRCSSPGRSRISSRAPASTSSSTEARG